MDGRRQAKAWQEWTASPEGLKAAEGTASGQYLENRLALAFKAGVAAAEKDMADRIETAFSIGSDAARRSLFSDG